MARTPPPPQRGMLKISSHRLTRLRYVCFLCLRSGVSELFTGCNRIATLSCMRILNVRIAFFLFRFMYMYRIGKRM